MDLEKCHCGRLPRLKKRAIDYDQGVKYLYYSCFSCGIETFATRKEEFCLELWNATVRKQKEMFKKK